MTRVLWLTPEVPEPGGTGGAIRAFHLLQGALRHGLRPVVIAPSYPEQERRARVTAEAGVELALVPRPGSRTREAVQTHLRHPALAGAVVTRPFLGWQADVFWREMRRTVARELERAPDVAVVEHDFCLHWGLRLPADLPVAFAAHNATWLQLARDAEASAGWRRAALRAEAARFRRHVRAALPRCSWWAAVSDGDAAAMQRLGAGTVHVAPNGADMQAFGDLPVGGGVPGRLLFAGTLSYPPNADAVRWLMQEVLPRVRRSAPEAHLRVVGRGAPADVARAAAVTPGVELLGWVDDLRPELASAAVALAPLRSGGGSRLKVVEALAAGRALVATTIGAEGLDFEDREHLRLADDAAGLADVIVELLGDAAQRERLGRAGRDRAVSRYDWTSIADGFGSSLSTWARERP